MVTKLRGRRYDQHQSLSLAKIHMVTKHNYIDEQVKLCLSLAKIHMVTKQFGDDIRYFLCLSLAKIHMVTKLADRMKSTM